MKFTPEQVIEMAREADEDFRNLEGDMADAVCGIAAITRLCTLAAERALEAAAQKCDVTPPQPFRPSIEAAHAIRAMKEQQ